MIINGGTNPVNTNAKLDEKLPNLAEPINKLPNPGAVKPPQGRKIFFGWGLILLPYIISGIFLSIGMNYTILTSIFIFMFACALTGVIYLKISVSSSERTTGLKVVIVFLIIQAVGTILSIMNLGYTIYQLHQLETMDTKTKDGLNKIAKNYNDLYLNMSCHNPFINSFINSLGKNGLRYLLYFHMYILEKNLSQTYQNELEKIPLLICAQNITENIELIKTRAVELNIEAEINAMLLTITQTQEAEAIPGW